MSIRRSELRFVFFTAMAVVLAVQSGGAQGADSAPKERTVLAVFAHPDDETMVGPLLARYARQKGTKVYLAIVTNGDKGVTPFANIPAGEALAAARAKEAACACERLGVQPPILLGLPDAGLNSTQTLAEAAMKLQKVIAERRPDAIVTWGPDGGYGHPDHRLVSTLVTQIVQAGDATRLLYYAGLPKSRMDSDAVKMLKFPAPFAPTADDLLNTRVAYSTDDAARARKSLACHTSQFPPQTMDLISTLTETIHGGQMHLRLWTGGAPRSDLFEP